MGLRDFALHIERSPNFAVSLPTPHLRIGRRLKDNRDPSIPTSRAHQVPFWPPKGKVRPSRTNQRLQVQLLAVDALAHGTRL